MALAQDFEARAKFGILFVPETAPVLHVIAYVANPHLFLDLDKGLTSSMGMHGTVKRVVHRSDIHKTDYRVYRSKALTRRTQ